MALTKDDLRQIGDLMDDKLEPVKKDLDYIKKELFKISTVTQYQEMFAKTASLGNLKVQS